MEPNKKEMKIVEEEDMIHAWKGMTSLISLISRSIITSNILTAIFCCYKNITFFNISIYANNRYLQVVILKSFIWNT